MAAKLQLVAAFVAAHSIAQQVISAHFADTAPAGSTSASTGLKDHAQSETGPKDHHGARADSLSSTCDDTRQLAADAELGSASNGTGRESEDAAVAQEVLQESRAEADAALQYAHQVGCRLYNA